MVVFHGLGFWDSDFGMSLKVYTNPENYALQNTYINSGINSPSPSDFPNLSGFVLG